MQRNGVRAGTDLSVLHVLVPEPDGEVGGADLHVRDLAMFQRSVGANCVVAERGSRDYAHRLSQAGTSVLSATGLSFTKSVAYLADAISTLNPSIVHAHGYDADYWAVATKWRYASLFRSRALVVTQHGIIEDTLWHKSKTVIDALAIRSANGIIACAEDLVARMRKWCPNALIRYIPNGVQFAVPTSKDSARARLHLPVNAFIIGYVGRLSPEKRPDRVIRLVASARAQDMRVEAVIAGSGPMRQDLERLSRTLGVFGAVHFLGYVESMSDVYGAIDVLVLLSATETTSRVVIEAMGSRVPVIASAVGGVPELLAGGALGHLVQPDNAPAALQALSTVMACPDRLVSEAFVRASRDYGIQVMGNRVLQFYSDVLQSRLRNDLYVR